jgi:signal transduction histidine kinase/CheY-like chemotaxis protein
MGSSVQDLEDPALVRRLVRFDPVRSPTSGKEDPFAWRDRLTLRLLRAFCVLFVTAGFLVTLTIEDGAVRSRLALISFLGALLLGVPAVTGKPGGTARAWLIVGPGVLASMSAYATIGYLSGPGVLLAITLMLSGLLLGRKAMMGLTLACGGILTLIAWGMVNGYLRAPLPDDVSMTNMTGWLRTLSVTFLAIFLFNGLMLAVVTRIENALSLAQKETLRREQAERERAEAEIVALEARQLETIGRLAAGVAHDFNNNLTAIIGAADLLALELPRDHPGREMTDSIMQASQRSAELTRQLLAYSRKAQMLQTPVDLHRIINEAVSLVRRSIDPKIQVVTELAAARPTVQADPSLLQNAVLNLLVNACDAMPAGGILTVSTTSVDLDATPGDERPTGPAVLLEVLDTGKGIPEEILPEIFNPFVTTKPLGKGTGLGLAAVAGTVKAHGGSIEVESDVGVGTVFRVYLPCTGSQPSAPPAAGRAVVTGQGEVLLIDDDMMVSMTAVATLTSFGYTVTHAADGRAGLALVQEDPDRFRLVLLDLRMPGMSGEQTFDAISKVAPGLPVLIWSGYGAEQDVSAMLRRGAVGFVQKPYRVAELSRTVSESLRPLSKV